MNNRAPRAPAFYTLGKHKGFVKPREPRPEVVACRVTKAEMGKVKELAEAEGLSVAAWVRVKLGLGR